MVLYIYSRYYLYMTSHFIEENDNKKATYSGGGDLTYYYIHLRIRMLTLLIVWSSDLSATHNDKKLNYSLHLIVLSFYQSRPVLSYFLFYYTYILYIKLLQNLANVSLQLCSINCEFENLKLHTFFFQSNHLYINTGFSSCRTYHICY